jgi:ATP dependent DNA ligase-like protein
MVRDSLSVLTERDCEGAQHLGFLIVAKGPKSSTRCFANGTFGFVPASRRQVFEKIRHLVSPVLPFANLPDAHKSRWGDELTAEKMKECVWLRPEAVAQIEFLEWTGANRLRHAKFGGLRDDKNPREVLKEG